MTDHNDRPASEAAVSPPTAGGVVGDTPSTEGLQCAQCRYALAGLRLDGRCPECGLDIPESILWWDQRRLRPLIRGGRAYVNTIFAGSLLLLIGSAMCVLAGLAWVLVFDAMGHRLTYTSPPGIALVTAAIILLAGCVLLTVREPGAPEHRRIRFARWFIRGGSLASIVALWPAVGVWIFSADLGSPFVLDVGSLCMMTAVALLTVLFAYISWLAARTEAGALESWSKSLAVCLIIALVVENVLIGTLDTWRLIGSAALPLSIASFGLVFISAGLAYRMHKERRPTHRPAPFSVQRPGETGRGLRP